VLVGIDMKNGREFERHREVNVIKDNLRIYHRKLEKKQVNISNK
jgi:hypothetical protein